MKIKHRSLAIAIALAATTTITPVASHAAGTITFGEDKYVSVGFGVLAGYSSVEDTAPNGDDSSDFDLNVTRVYLSGGINKYIKGMVNIENSGGTGDKFSVIDAAAIFQINPELEIYAGRFLSPSSRANMAGPFYSSGDGYWQNIVARYGWNGGEIGRDEGVAIVGTAADERLAYSFGVFEGGNIFKLSGLINEVGKADGFGETIVNNQQDDELMYAGRLQYAFWDKEPGYYGTGNYFGSKDIFTIGVAARVKGDGAASDVAVGDYSQVSVDLLMEKQLAAGAVSLEAAYYDYDTDDVFLSEQGDAYAVSVGFIFKEKLGWGQVMPLVRYQSFDNDNNVEQERTDLGVNYVIDGYNAQISSFYRMAETTGAADQDTFVVNMQVQF
jgi:hypothetical protein